VVPKILLLVEQIRPATAQIYNLGAAIPVLLQAGAFEAVEGVGDALATADDAFVLVVAEGAFVADAGEGRGAHVGVADGAFSVALVTEAADGDAGLFAAHDQVGMVARHGDGVAVCRWMVGGFSSATLFGCRVVSVS
jgi:hypothetical protein